MRSFSRKELAGVSRHQQLLRRTECVPAIFRWNGMVLRLFPGDSNEEAKMIAFAAQTCHTPLIYQLLVRMTTARQR